jgi:hypothetical protein
MKTSSRTALRVLLYGAVLLFLAAVAIPNYMKARWTSGGVGFVFDVRVLDDATGGPVAGAGVIVYYDAGWPVSGKPADTNSATTDESGRCQVTTNFGGSGRGTWGRLSVGKTVFVRADGYEPWERPCQTILGEFVEVTTGPHTAARHALEVRLRKQATK